ncbi:NAD(P)-dependent oxidoreductase [Candidatus Campbellbacteria bacterium CG22_combo_CG10-13_8_21_14_all_36_13]|uniref:dTDP-4-dehydrorhamnose reductase n=1 Tax=Candidatus Campbellbacteria bacterium CG22_combo_CG10-13_8_21_14_all_36_13 TaxID=1974529 RepID=A0A2H0DYT6_9BACT|nr:MAG: NAD(P)-dependent oxidoreductase [Candidatus Campbellbacteria bacterium CG22_combo_CG10-13_8_21_14_all_36_13]
MINKEDKIVITGCGGMLGEAVYSEFKDICKVYASDIDLNEDWLEYLDVSSANAVAEYLENIKPDYIIHLAAKTDMEYCELNSEETYATNRNGVTHVVKYANSANIPVVYISTAGIFDGEQESYREEDKPNPLSVYGRSKYEGELEAKKATKSIVVRAGWMIGGGPKKDKKFVKKIVEQINNGSKQLHVVNDKFGTPCYTYDLAKSLHFLVDNEYYGIYHGACDGKCNRYEVAVAMMIDLGIKDEVEVIEVDSSFVEKDFFAPRPRSEILQNIRLKKIAPHLTRDWEICVKEYLNKFDWLERS